MPVSRDELFALAALPLGGEEYMEAAKSAPQSPLLKELNRRINKRWLPAGKRQFNPAQHRAAKKEFAERQFDIEDAVEAAGGSRGSLA